MRLTPQLALSFNGDCEAAFRFYERCFEGAVTFMLTWADSPMAGQAPPGWGSKICHATLKVGETAIAGSDVPSDRYERPQGFSVTLQMDDPAAAERVFRTLSEGGRIDRPLQQTFWAERFGVVVDRFGIPWAVNCEAGGAAAGS
jgi:PhnB protein